MALVCWGLVGAGIYIQKSDPFINPCPMCIFQRILFLIIGIIAMVAAVSARWSKKSVPVFSVLGLLVAAVGVYTAGKQSWMQWHPLEGSSCGRDDDFYTMVERMPMRDWLPTIFKGTGDCANIDWTFLGLSIANWSFIAFVCCIIALLLMLFKGGKLRRSERWKGYH
jgi:disulfide bond formation protein DsbB